MADTLTTQKRLEQGRVEFAYKCAEEGNGLEKKTEYKSYVKKIPMLIKSNGIGATFAYINSKAKDGNAYELIYQQVAEWLKIEPKSLFAERLINNEDLTKAIISLDSTEYRTLTNEVLAFFTWLKRFADGLIEGDAENE